MSRKPRDPREGLTRLFGEAAEGESSRATPFADAPTGSDPTSRVHAAVIRLRRVRSQVSAEGLTPAATRALLDEVIQALEAVAEGLSDASQSTRRGDG